MERLIGQAKAKLLTANTADPAIRYCSLFDMRCTTNTLTITTDLMRFSIEEQRLAADTANQTERFRRRKQTTPTALTS